MEEKLSQIQSTYLDKINQAKTLKELDEIFLALFGKSGEITLLPKQFKALPKEDLQKIGPLFNQIKSNLELAVEQKREVVREKSYEQLSEEVIDFSKTVDIASREGILHPLTQFELEVAKIFGDLGFLRFDAPHIDTDYNNFEVLNIPQEHPARDLWDTLYIDAPSTTEGEKLLLRTHTSNSQIRIMKEDKPPIKRINIGRCFRYENLDARHEHTFDQFELVYIDEGLNMAHLQYLSEYFLKHIFGRDVKVRLKPKYYPFVEPGAGVDGECIFCNGEGCKICGGTGWLELAGAGMIHPNVLKNGGIDSSKYSGIAWGAGPLRMLMLKHNVEDVRLFLSGDLKFLEKFKVTSSLSRSHPERLKGVEGSSL